MLKFYLQLRSIDWLLVVAVFALTLFGLAAIYSVALSRADFSRFKVQLMACAIGCVIFLFFAVWNYRLLRNYSLVIYVLAALSLIGLLIFGQTIRGTTGWFSLGFVHVQPVEFVKFALIVVLAAYFSQRARRQFGLRELIESGAMAFFLAILVFLQPDFGSAVLLLCIWFVMMLFAGLRKRHLLGLLLVAVACVFIGWFFFFADYQRARLTTFFDPSSDPLGQGYNVSQAVIAVGAGGWFGRGLGFGSQSQLKFLPESQTDFIFAVVAEELGFVGVLLVLTAFFLLFQRLLHYATTTRDSFTSFLLLGIGASLFVQSVVNIGMNLGLMPVTGLGLPLVSYGGTSIVFTLLMLGIVQSVAIRARGTQSQ